MRAAIFRGGDLVVDETADPKPGEGQVIVKTLACGICGSDLHAFHHAGHMAEAMKRTGAREVMDPSRDIIFGHEFSAEIVEHGPGTAGTLKPGTRVCSIPISVALTGDKAEVRSVGYSNETPGGFAEYMALNELLLLEIPNGLSSEHAALTEPMAVGWHAVEKAKLVPEDVCLVIGCGPVGLAVIAGLKIKGVSPIIAADFSPARRALAKAMGADVVIDPAAHSPYASWQEMSLPKGYDPFNIATLLGMGPQPRPGVIFECVGVPGVIQQIIEGSMKGTRIVVVGVCMEKDGIEPLFAITREINLQFVLAYTPDEFALTLRHIAEGQIDVAPLITGRVGLDEVKTSFTALANPEKHAKILVEPWR